MKRDIFQEESRNKMHSEVFQELINQGVVVPPESEGSIHPLGLEWKSEKSISEILDEIREDRV